MTMHLFLTASAALGTMGIISIVVIGVLSLPALYFVHRCLEYHYLWLARRYCAKNGLKPVRWRCGPEFEKSGVKTEFTVVELDCLDNQQQRKLVRLLVWVFGIRKVISDETPSA
jgi:hypothetical protein